MAESNSLVVIVRTYNFEVPAVAHEPPAACNFPMNRVARTLTLLSRGVSRLRPNGEFE